MPRARKRRRSNPRVSPGEVLDRLDETRGEVSWTPRMDALDELLFTVLTQHTSDSNAAAAYRSMRDRYPSWGEVLETGTDALADAIRHGGLADQKAPRLQAILAEILRRRGEFNLDFLGGLPLDEARAWLTSLPGVGPKTAAVTLAFSLGMPAMPVDTHVYRVARRLGLIPLSASVDEAHGIMEAQVQPERVYAYHVQLIAHGRETCRAQRPLCGECPLGGLCPSAEAFTAAAARPAYRRPLRRGKPL